MKIAKRKLDELKLSIIENVLFQLFAEFKRFVVTLDVPEIKKFIGSYVDSFIEHVEVIFKHDGTEIDALPLLSQKKSYSG
ncbi:hypothetical protein [Paenibacillus koleovorans]|uniref:hypothetical protein n=1 Tax=Paenibacillus koleovorans TaxID=121608 RepID=UPI000FDA3BDD|nr:hypothetical protein [Paenibacillus koleovorans]